MKVKLKTNLEPDELNKIKKSYKISENKIYDLISTPIIYDVNTYKELPPNYLLYGDDKQARLVNNGVFCIIFDNIVEIRNEKITKLGI